MLGHPEHAYLDGDLEYEHHYLHLIPGPSDSMPMRIGRSMGGMLHEIDI